MVTGYERPLYILPFDHRASYESTVFGYHEPLTKEQVDDVARTKEIIYDGFKMALAAGVSKEKAGLLVDEEFGAAVLMDAKAKGYTFALTMEKSGQEEFDVQYPDYRAHVEKFDPTFLKVLVRYNVDADAEMNRRQTARLVELSKYARSHGRLFMFELLVPAEKSQLATVNNDKAAYDTKLRPGLMAASIRTLQEAGVEPDVWKIEGLDSKDDCRMIVETARRGGRDKVGCIILGRGENEKKVLEWLTAAAQTPGFIGFAVGRSSFLQSVMDERAKKITREEASKQIAEKFREWVETFEKASAGR